VKTVKQLEEEERRRREEKIMDKKKEHLKSIEVLIDQLELPDDEEEETGMHYFDATRCLPITGPHICLSRSRRPASARLQTEHPQHVKYILASLIVYSNTSATNR
jgi:hypothetical protein